MSYGWAIFVITVLGIVLYNLGAFNASSASVVSGFAFLKPISVQVSPQDSGNALIVLQVQNAGGKDYSISSTTISTPRANCSFNLNFVQDTTSGNTIATAHPFALSTGQEVKLTYWANGSNCGSNANYDYKIGFSGTDYFGITQTDSGNIRGKPKVCNFPQSGLIGLWHFKEGSGSAAADDSGNGNNGVATGTQILPGKTGLSRNFSGTTDKITVASTLINATDNFTILAWVKKTAGGTIDYIAGNYGTGACNGGVEFYLNSPDTTSTLILYISGYAFSSTPFSNGDWHSVGVTRSGSVVLFYLDGRLDATRSLTSPINATCNFTIGNGPNYTSERFRGSIDEVMVYNRALSASEIQRVYDCGQ
jgi:hypothetical protein